MMQFISPALWRLLGIVIHITTLQYMTFNITAHYSILQTRGNEEKEVLTNQGGDNEPLSQLTLSVLPK